MEPLKSTLKQAHCWDSAKSVYTCTDNVHISIRVLELSRRSRVAYDLKADPSRSQTVCISGVSFGRRMDFLVQGINIRTLCLPRSVRRVQPWALHEVFSLERVLLNPGLQALGDGALAGTGLTELTLPASLEEVGPYLLSECAIKAVYLEDGCAALVGGLLGEGEPSILPALGTLAGGVPLWGLRGLYEVTIPEGVTRVGSFWFSSSAVEEVFIPASARVLGEEAFSCCARLAHVDFVPGSVLEEVGVCCFQKSGLHQICIPAGVRVIRSGAFSLCEALSEISFAEGSALKEVGTMAFASSGLEVFVSPPGLRVLREGAFANCR